MADEDIQIALDPTRDDTTGEYFNLDETGEKKGPLQRYLKAIGYTLDEAKGLLDAFPVMIDVDNTDPMFLAPMGKLVGINFNDDISITQAREEIKKAVPWYKRKCTHSGNELYGYMISRVNCLSRAFVDNVLISTRDTNSLKYTYNESADTSDPEKRYYYDLPGDITGFSEDYVHKSYMTPREVTASSAQTGHDAVFAVDQSEQSSWKPLVSDTNNHIQFTFDDDKLPSWVRVFGCNGIRDFAIEHSSDGLTWYRDAEYRIGCFERYNHYLGTYVPGITQFYTRKSLIENVPDERLFVVTPSSTVFGYLTKAATADDTIIEVSDPTLFAEDEWVVLANGTYKTCVQIKEISGNRMELYGKVMMSNGFPQYDTVVYKTSSVLRYPYGYVMGTSDYSGDNLNGLDLQVNINGHVSLVTFSGFDATSTAYEAALFINNHITYGAVEVVNNRLRLVSNIIGTMSFASVVGGTALSELGLAVGTGYGAYSIDTDSGLVTIRGDQFNEDDQLAIIYTALEDKSVIDQWYSFKVPQYLREPVKYWRVSIMNTWGGEKEIKEVELHGNEYYPRLYRHERIGLYLNFGNIQQTCTANVCNKPVTQETLAKLMRYSCTAIPAGYEMVLGVLDCHYKEDADQRVNLFESYYDTQESLDPCLTTSIFATITSVPACASGMLPTGTYLMSNVAYVPDGVISDYPCVWQATINGYLTTIGLLSTGDFTLFWDGVDRNRYQKTTGGGYSIGYSGPITWNGGCTDTSIGQGCGSDPDCIGVTIPSCRLEDLPSSVTVDFGSTYLDAICSHISYTPGIDTAVFIPSTPEYLRNYTDGDNGTGFSVSWNGSNWVVTIWAVYLPNQGGTTTWYIWTGPADPCNPLGVYSSPYSTSLCLGGSSPAATVTVS